VSSLLTQIVRAEPLSCARRLLHLHTVTGRKLRVGDNVRCPDNSLRRSDQIA